MQNEALCIQLLVWNVYVQIGDYFDPFVRRTFKDKNMTKSNMSRDRMIVLEAKLRLTARKRRFRKVFVALQLVENREKAGPWCMNSTGGVRAFLKKLVKF